MSDQVAQKRHQLQHPVLQPIISTDHNDPDVSIEFIVAHVTSPGEFWVHLAQLGSDVALSDVTDGLRDCCGEANQAAAMQRFYQHDYTVGDLVCARFEGDLYRAEIVGASGGDCGGGVVMYDVYYVDYGNSKRVTRDEIFPLPPHLRVVHGQAVKCSLHGVKPHTEQTGTILKSHIKQYD